MPKSKMSSQLGKGTAVYALTYIINEIKHKLIEKHGPQIAKKWSTPRVRNVQ